MGTDKHVKNLGQKQTINFFLNICAKFLSNLEAMGRLKHWLNT
jgi:hypothetical protein